MQIFYRKSFFGLLALVALMFSCTEKNPEVTFLIETKPNISKKQVVKYFEPHEVLSINPANRTLNQYICKVKVKQGQRADLVSKIQSLDEVISIEIPKSQPAPPTNSTNDKRSKTKPIKSNSDKS